MRSLIQAEFPKLTIDRDYDPSIPELMADKNQLIQAFLNFARNSAQSVNENQHKKGEITFRTRINRQHTVGNKRYKHVMQIDIIDNGPGIADEVLENLFLPMVTNKADGT